MTKDEALRLALEALEKMQNAIYNIGGEHVIDLNFAIEQADVSEDAITAIKAALEAKDEPFCWYDMEHGEIQDVEWNRQKPTYEGNWKPLYKTPPQQEAKDEPAPFNDPAEYDDYDAAVRRNERKT